MSRRETVRHSIDPVRPASLTATQKAELTALAALPEEQIDNTSDIPPLTEAFWENAVRNPFYRPGPGSRKGAS